MDLHESDLHESESGIGVRDRLRMRRIQMSRRPESDSAGDGSLEIAIDL